MKEFFKKTFTKENMMKFFRTYIWLMVLLFVIDIVTKWVIVNHFGVLTMESGARRESGAIELIKNFLYIGGAINSGAAFSLFSGSRIPLLLISLVMTGGFIAYYIVQYKKLTTLYKIALALMIAGGFGNLIDRAFYWESTVGFGGVVDWILVYFGKNDMNGFPMFNIADSCLVVGIIIVFVAIIIDEVKASKKKRARGEYNYSPEQLKEKEKRENEGNKSE